MVTNVQKKIGVFALALVLVAVGFFSYHYYNEHHEPALPPIASHTDIPKQSLLTFAQSLTKAAPSDLSNFQDSKCAPLTPGWLQQENQQTGVPMTIANWAKIDIANPEGSALWIDKTSVSCGDTVNVHASLYDLNTGGSPNERGPRRIVVMRIGWYNGSGAKIAWETAPIKLVKQRIPFATSATRMIETNWKTTTSFTIGADWKPGFYMVTSISPSGKIEGMSPMILRSPVGSSKLLFVHSTITWAAYDLFGSRSTYFGPGNNATKRMAERSRISSMDRPITGSGAVHIQRDAISFVQYLEQQGIQVDQIADTDLDQWPSISSHYNGLVFSGHAEYMTRRIFDTLVAARNTGINLAFFGANTGYWQTRLEPSPSGIDRHVVIYRVATEYPITDPMQVTVQFQDKRVNTPAALFTGGTTDGVHVYGNLRAKDIPSWLNIPKTASLLGWSSDSEIEGISKSHAAPPNMHVLFQGMMKLRATPTLSLNLGGKPTPRIPLGQSIWFTTPSGSAVFNAAITLWPCDLLPSCSVTQMDSTSRATLQSVTSQVLALWSQKQIGLKLK